MIVILQARDGAVLCNDSYFTYGDVFYDDAVFYRSEMGLQDYVRQELSRLERQAQNAYTEGEALNCELKAVELQISLVTIY